MDFYEGSCNLIRKGCEGNKLDMNVVSIRVVPILKKIEKGPPYFFMAFIKMITLKRVMTYYEKVFLLLSYRTYARSL